MKLLINGKEKQIDKDTLTISELLQVENVEMPEMVSVELNEEIIERSNYPTTVLKEGDAVEFLYFMGGGGLQFETKAVHAGFNQDKQTGATALPIYYTSSFAYNTAEELADVFDGREFGYVYSRISNPTVTAFEQRLNALENGLGAIATSSGMSAIATVLFALTESGDEIVSAKSLFGGTFLLFNEVLKKYGVNTNYVDTTDVTAYEKAINEKTKLIFLETLGNPKLDVPDINSIAEIASKKNVPIVVDGTLTTPYLFESKKFGASITIHSTTKYISGNGTGIGGIIIDLGNYDWKNARTEKIRTFSKKFGNTAFLVTARKTILQNIGNCLSPFNAFIQNLGLETLALRMEKHCDNAAYLAEFLKNSNKTEAVNYPGLKDNPYNKIAGAQFNGKYGALLTLRLGSRQRCFQLIKNLKTVKNLANLGDAKTLIIHPASTIYHDCSEAEMKSAGVTDDMVRISAGIEHRDDIVQDFEQALRET